MTVTVHFCGAARTVTGSCYLFQSPNRTATGRLRSVSGIEDAEGTELWCLSVPPGRHRYRALDPCPHRPQRLAPEACTRTASADGSLPRAAPSTCAPICCPTQEAFRNGGRHAQSAQYGARAIRGQLRSIPKPTPSHPLLPSGRSITGHGLRSMRRRPRTLLECRPSPRLGFHRTRVRRRGFIRTAVAGSRLWRHRP